MSVGRLDKALLLRVFPSMGPRSVTERGVGELHQWLNRHNQSLKRAENPFLRGNFRDKMAKSHVHCVHKLQVSMLTAPNNEPGKTNLYFNQQ